MCLALLGSFVGHIRPNPARQQHAYQQNAPPETVSLSITAIPKVVKSGECVIIAVTIENRTRQLFWGRFDPGAPAPDVWLTAADEHGRPAPSTAFARAKLWGGSFRIEKIEPGSSFHGRLYLTRRWDITLPGEYTVEATARWAPSHPVSNKVTITVVP
ncbi:MAG: hypothetical protein ACRD2D_11735 [Terriglobales bacterium]